MSGLGTPMAVIRGLHLAATLSLLGTAGFIAWLLPAAAVVPDHLRRWLRRLWWVSGLIALLAGVAWFVIQSTMIADAGSLSEVLAALPLVAAHTRYGNMMMVRLGLLILATALVWNWPAHGSTKLVERFVTRLVRRPLAVSWPGPARLPGTFPGSTSQIEGGRPKPGADPKGKIPAPTSTGRGPSPGTPTGIGRNGTPSPIRLYATLAITIIALSLQGLIGHAGATAGATGDGLVLSEALHLLAAGIWFGALLPLWLSLRALPPSEAALVCERFSPIGLACVLVLAGTGFAQGLQLIGGLPALFGTTYGHIILLKIALFLVALTLAGLNRLWLTDRLAAGTAAARRHLLVSVSVETLIGLAIVTAAAFLASSPPAAHSEPVWPFSWQFSLITVNEDPEFRHEVAFSLVAIGAAVVLTIAALLRRRLRLVALAILTLAVVLRGPSLALLTVEAYPTSFQTSPTGFAAASIVRGQALFAQNCTACHGARGDGTGPAAASLRIRPADLTAPHIWEHTDGEMFWWLTHGVDNPEGGLAMPGFGDVLSADDRWALIDYIRANNAGVAMQQDSVFDIPVHAPALTVTCAGIAASSMTGLLGRPIHVVTVHVVTGPAREGAVPPRDGATNVVLDLRDGAEPVPGGCVAADPAAWGAYAVLAGLPPDELAGAEFLIDRKLWLRAVHRPGATGGWLTPDGLIAAFRSICAHPIEQLSGGQHDRHH